MVDEDRLNKLKNILENDPDSPVFTQYADLLRKANRIDEAITILENGIRKHPNNSTAYLILGRCYNDKGAVESAVQNYEHASELEPQNVLAHKELGNAYISIGEKDKALALFKKVFEIDNGDMEVKKIIDELTNEESQKSVDEDIGSMGDKGDFFSFFDNAIPPEKSEAIEQPEKLKKPEEPEKFADEGVQTTPSGQKKPDWLTVELAKMYIEHNFRDKAIDILERLQKFGSENQEVIDLLEKLGVIKEPLPQEEKITEEKSEPTAKQEFTETFGGKEEEIQEEKPPEKKNKPLAEPVSLDELFGDKEKSPKPPSPLPKPEEKEGEETKDIGQFKSWLNNMGKEK